MLAASTFKSCSLSVKNPLQLWRKSDAGVIYDNQPGAADDADATTGLGGGNIVIHK
jgi:hypothetical protein